MRTMILIDLYIVLRLQAVHSAPVLRLPFQCSEGGENSYGVRTPRYFCFFRRSACSHHKCRGCISPCPAERKIPQYHDRMCREVFRSVRSPLGRDEQDIFIYEAIDDNNNCNMIFVT